MKTKRAQTPRRGASDERHAAIVKVHAMLSDVDAVLGEFPDDLVAGAQKAALDSMYEFLAGRVDRVRRRKGGL